MSPDNDDGPILRMDWVELHKDRENALWGLSWTKVTGVLALVDGNASRSVVFQPSGPYGEGWEVDFDVVRFLGEPPPWLGMRFIARRSMRVDVAGRRWIVTFTGVRSDTSEHVRDIQLERLGGDIDPVTAIRGLMAAWENRRFWSESQMARDAWCALLSKPANDV